MTEFKREHDRYIVIKRSDLSPQEIKDIEYYIAHRPINTRECVVIETDWPIYEQVWGMVQRMAEGREQVKLDPKMLNHFTCERVNEAESTPGFTLFMTKMGASHSYQLYQNEAEALHFNLGKALGINPDAHLDRLAELEDLRNALLKVQDWVNELGNETQNWDFADQVQGYIQSMVNKKEPSND